MRIVSFNFLFVMRGAPRDTLQKILFEAQSSLAHAKVSVLRSSWRRSEPSPLLLTRCGHGGSEARANRK